ncbi:MAG: hypothetical protein WCC64_09910 [Aliidongia sp.]
MSAQSARQRIIEIMLDYDPSDWPVITADLGKEAARAVYELRDSAIRHARSLMPDKTTTGAADEISTALARYLASGWRHNQNVDHITDADPKKRAVHRIAKLNNGRPIRSRQIFNVLRDNRSGYRMQ